MRLLVPVIGAAVDPMRAIIILAGTVADASAGVVLTRIRSALPLPGLPGHPALREAPLTRVEVHVPMEGTLGRAGNEPERQRNVAEPMKCLETVDETTELGEGGHASDYVSSTEIARPSTERRTASTINGAAMLFLALT